MNGYRRGAYQDMTKDMNSGEKTLKAMQGVKAQIGFLINSAFALDTMH